MFRSGLRTGLILVFAASCVYSFIVGRWGFGLFFLAMSIAFILGGIKFRRR